MDFKDRQKKFQKVGEFSEYKTPAKIEVVTRVPIPVQEEKSKAPLEMQKMGDYSVARATPQGQIVFQPLAPLPQYIENGGAYHLGGAYYESQYGYVVAIKDGIFRDFTNFKGENFGKRS